MIILMIWTLLSVTETRRDCAGRREVGINLIQLACDVHRTFWKRRFMKLSSNLPGVTGIADDIVSVGYKEDGSDHGANLYRVFKRPRETCMKLNLDKTKIKCQRILFYGHIIRTEGLEPDPGKIQTILAMEEPHYLKNLQTFLGMVTYLGKFTPHLSALAAPLHDISVPVGTRTLYSSYTAQEYGVVSDITKILRSKATTDDPSRCEPAWARCSTAPTKLPSCIQGQSTCRYRRTLLQYRE